MNLPSCVLSDLGLFYIEKVDIYNYYISDIAGGLTIYAGLFFTYSVLLYG